MAIRRISVNPTSTGVVPCVRGLKIPVAAVLAMLAEGMSDEDILKAFPDLTADDIRETRQYASEAVPEPAIPPANKP